MDSLSVAKEITALTCQINSMKRTMERFKKGRAKLIKKHSASSKGQETAPGQPIVVIQMSALYEIDINSKINEDLKHLWQWNPETICLIHVLYAASPKAYRRLRYRMPVPAVST
jgi:hypothetical protein